MPTIEQTIEGVVIHVETRQWRDNTTLTVKPYAVIHFQQAHGDGTMSPPETVSAWGEHTGSALKFQVGQRFRARVDRQVSKSFLRSLEPVAASKAG